MMQTGGDTLPSCLCRLGYRTRLHRITPRAVQITPVAFPTTSARCDGAGQRTRMIPQAADVSEYGSARDCPIQAGLGTMGCWEDLTAAHIMSPSVLSINAEASVFKAMETLVEAGVSGLPVVDGNKKVLGVVTAYDVLALDCTPGKLDKSDGFFPPVNKCINDFDGDRQAMWRAFLSLRKSIDKAKASQVGDSMHETFTVPLDKPLMDVADVIVQKKTHRVFVVDENEDLVGVVSRGDIMRATVRNFKYYVQSSAS